MADEVVSARIDTGVVVLATEMPWEFKRVMDTSKRIYLWASISTTMTSIIGMESGVERNKKSKESDVVVVASHVQILSHALNPSVA